MNRHTLLSVLTAGMVLGAGAARSAETAGLPVVADGQSPYVIALAAESEERHVLEAARLLQSTLVEATGVELPIVKESEVESGTPAIYLGKSAAARRAGLPVDEVRGWGYLNRVVGQDIFLVGADEAGAGNTRSIGYYGSLKAVTAFLEHAVGARFVLPGRLGTHVPKLERVRVDPGMSRSWAPPFSCVAGRSVSPPDRAYAVANNFFGKEQGVVGGSVHLYNAAVPAKVYFEKHPEYFALLGGTRNPTARGHVCISNPEVQELLLKYMESILDQGYEWVNLGQTDGYQECECENCRAIHPDRGEALWIVHRNLAEEMHRRRPGKRVVIMSYVPTAPPPTSFSEFPENVMIMLTRITEEDFAEWARFDVPKTVYVTAYLGTAPRIAPRYAMDLVRRFLRHDVRGIQLGGGLDQSNAPWGLFGPSYYAFGKAIEYPERTADDLEKEYVEAAFGEAAAPMQAFFEVMHRRLEINALMDGQREHRFGGAAGDWLCHFYPPKVLADMSSHLARALALAKDEKVKARLDLVDLEFNYLRSAASVYHFYRAYRLAPGWTLLDLLADRVQDYKEAWTRLFPDDQVRPAAGLRPPYNGRRDVRYGGVPFSWDFALLREKQALPGVGMKRLDVARTAPFTVDGDLDKPPWRDVPFHDLDEINLGRLQNKSRFKVAYDEANFYVAFQAEISAPDALDYLVPVGRDGGAWLQENVELMIDPFGERARYCHFIINPLPDSTFDQRLGYIDDPFHPLYGQNDKDWNGQWDYAARIDPENKRWTVEVRIPFATLECSPPRPGAVWTMNVGRTEIIRHGNGGRTFSLWSPNLENRSFHERSTFGVVEFR